MADERQQWEQAYERTPLREGPFETMSGVPLEAVHGEADVGGSVTRALPRLGDDGLVAEVVELVHVDHPHAGVVGELPHVRIVQRPADSDLGGACRVEQTFLDGVRVYSWRSETRKGNTDS